MGFASLTGCSVVVELILKHIDDLDVRNLSKAGSIYYDVLNESVSSKSWKKRAKKQYGGSDLGRRLIEEIGIEDLPSYIKFIQQYNDILTLTYPAKLGFQFYVRILYAPYNMDHIIWTLNMSLV